jgi:hypothetical protein
MDTAVTPPTPEAADVDGRSICWFLEGVEEAAASAREAAETALTDRGTVSPRTNEWYPFASLLAAVEAVATSEGEEALAAAGRYCGGQLSPDATRVPDALAALDDAYRRHHRGAAGGYAFRQIGPTDGRVECATPYPCVFDRALVASVAESVADGVVCLSEVGRCRAAGENRCTYELTW